MQSQATRHAKAGWLSPLAIAASYFVVGGLWILFSDRAVELLFPPDVRTSAQTVKGWFYVSVTALFLYALIRKSTAELHRSEANVRAILASMAEGVLVGTSDGLITEMNDAARRMLGVESLSLPITGTQLRASRLPQDGANARTPLMRALQGESVEGERVVWRRDDGREVELEVSAAPLRRGRSGALFGGVAVMRDVTEHRRLERLRDTFLSDAAHELKTPVATMKAYVQLLRRWAPGGHEPREGVAFGVLARQCERIARIIEQLLELELTIAERGPEREPKAFDVAALAQDVVAQTRLIAPEHRFVVSGVPSLVVSADSARIELVLANLLDNAVKFSPAGTTVELALARNAQHGLVSVRDEGIGIPAERQAQVGERFFKAHAGTNDDAGGLGVGLFLSREIVRRAGGRLSVTSEPGRGTTIHFDLPLGGELS